MNDLLVLLVAGISKKQAYVGEDGESLITDFCPNCGANMREVTT